jgi:NADH-quinone oxidoreductase subunit G
MNEVHITVNGRRIAAECGELLIDVCRREGIEIPSFCSYPGLSPQGACRMCLVRIEKMPKLQTACTTQVGDGMAVETETEEIVAARKATLEILLANHPLDCPVCDAGGECELQDMTFACGAGESQFVEIKSHKAEQQWSPAVFYDRPRCILCYRCVRVCGEAMDVWALGVQNRGQGAAIAPNNGDRLDCEQCGQCIDICPVGALTSGSYRYQTRPWEMPHTATVCAHCADGCRVTLGSRESEQGREIVRSDNRDHGGLNGEFLCGRGRFGFDFVSRESRLVQPMIRQDGELVSASWSEALERIAGRFAEIRRMHGNHAIGVLGSNTMTNEENYLLQKFTRLVLETNNIDHPRTADYVSFADALARHGGREASIAEAATAKAVLLIGNDPTVRHPQLAWHLRNNARLRKMRLYAAHDGAIKLMRQARKSLRIPAARMAEFVDFLRGATACELPGEYASAAERTAFREELRQEPELLIVFGAELHGKAIETLVAWGAAQGASFLCLGDLYNSRGAADMGVLPHRLPGYLPVSAEEHFAGLWGSLPTEPGLTMTEMLDAAAEGTIKALYVAGTESLDPMQFTGTNATRPFLVLQGSASGALSKLADVILPTALPYEMEGSCTNTSGDVQRLRAAAGARGGKSAIEILTRLAVAMGFERERLYAPAAVKRVVTAQLRGPHSGEADRHELWLESNLGEAETMAFDPSAIFDEIQQQVPGYGFARGEWLLNGYARCADRKAKALPVQAENDRLRPLPQGLFTTTAELASPRVESLRKHQQHPHPSARGEVTA